MGFNLSPIPKRSVCQVASCVLDIACSNSAWKTKVECNLAETVASKPTLAPRSSWNHCFHWDVFMGLGRIWKARTWKAWVFGSLPQTSVYLKILGSFSPWPRLRCCFDRLSHGIQDCQSSIIKVQREKGAAACHGGGVKMAGQKAYSTSRSEGHNHCFEQTWNPSKSSLTWLGRLD